MQEQIGSLEFEKWIEEVIKQNAWYLHLSVGFSPVIEKNFRLEILDENIILTSSFIEDIVYNKLIEKQEQKEWLEREKELVFSKEILNNRFRVNIYFQKGFLSVVLKFIPKAVIPLNNLEYPDKVIDILNKFDKGVIIISGPFNSGKSTFSAAILDYFNQNFSRKILTIEDPIEYIIPSNNSIIEQQEIGKDIPSKVHGIVNAFEMPTDVLFVDNLNDKASFKKFFEFVQSGRLGIFTIETNSIIETFEKIESLFFEERNWLRDLLVNHLLFIINQKLLVGLSDKIFPVYEFLPNLEEIKNILIKGDYTRLQDVLYSQEIKGAISLEKSLAEKVKQGKIKIDIAMQEVNNKRRFQRYLNL